MTEKQTNSTDPVIVETLFNTSPEKIWRALTDNSEMKKWYFDLPAFEPAVGFEFSFTGGKDDRSYLHLCRVKEVIVGKRISYSWRYNDYEGISYVTFDVIPEGGKTRLRVTHEGLETFPQDNPDFAKENFLAGWTSIVGDSLKTYLNANEAV